MCTLVLSVPKRAAGHAWTQFTPQPVPQSVCVCVCGRPLFYRWRKWSSVCYSGAAVVMPGPQAGATEPPTGTPEVQRETLPGAAVLIALPDEGGHPELQVFFQ